MPEPLVLLFRCSQTRVETSDRSDRSMTRLAPLAILECILHGKHGGMIASKFFPALPSAASRLRICAHLVQRSLQAEAPMLLWSAAGLLDLVAGFSYSGSRKTRDDRILQR
mmetsp:Transcript_19499/g.34441  ORF Transcript_19499/g.34441 Transcript_19499/m.34441 type:complete len:111 (-) Transcript_19499:157-489(-)